MNSKAPTKQEKLRLFFRREFDLEEGYGFARLIRIPDTHVQAKLDYYRSLDDQESEAFRDCAAHWSAVAHSFIIGEKIAGLTEHPYFERWAHGYWNFNKRHLSVMSARATIQQYKMDAARGVVSSIPKEQFEKALLVRSVRAPELRKRAKDVLKRFGYLRKDELGYYVCNWSGREFKIHIDCGGHSQFRYVLSRPDFPDVHPLTQFQLERALGMGPGSWDNIVEENIEEVFGVFEEIIAYCYELPDRVQQYMS